MDSNTLKIGLLLDSTTVPAWTLLMLKKLQQSPHAEVTFLCINEGSGTGNNLDSLYRHNGSMLYKLYMALEDKVYATKPNPLAGHSMEALYPELTSISARQAASGEIDDSGLERIRAQEADILIQIGFQPLSGSILDAAKYGVWAYQFGRYQYGQQVPAGLWEILRKQSTVHSFVVKLGVGEPDKVMYSSTSSTGYISVNRTMAQCYWKSASFMERAVARLAVGAESNQSSEQGTIPNSVFSGKPSNLNMIGPLVGNFMTRLKGNLSGRSSRLQWMLMFDLNDDRDYSLESYKKLLPPPDRIWADPFALYREGKYYVFIEEAPFSTGKGHISVMELDAEGNWSDPVTIIEQPYHMSYPFLIERDGVLYMIPETSANKKIDVYRCEEFPHKWEFYKTLMDDVVGVDSTFIEHDGKWWLFVNMCENAGSSSWDELFVFYSDDPLSTDWQPHRLNPVVSDTRSARPAGAIFKENGKLIRPSQNCEWTYGYGLKFNEIMKLSPDDYEEREIRAFEPDWDPELHAVHTYNKVHHLTLTDGRVRRKV